MSDTPLRIGFYVFFPGGGIGRYTHELMRAMGERPGMEVEVICTPEYKWAQAEGYAPWTGLQSISHEVPTLRRWRFLKGQFVNPKRAINHAVEKNLDVLHLANINHLTFPYWRPALEKADVKVVASAHDVKRRKRIISRWWEERQLKAFYRFADALFVHSEHQARELLDFANVNLTKVHVVPHGPYAHSDVPECKGSIRAKWDLPSDRQVALMFGKIRDDKNLDGFLQAIALSSSTPFVVVAGNDAGRHRSVGYYKKIADRSGVDQQVRFIPRYITDEEVGELFVASDWIALPYDDTFTSQSGVLNVAVHYNRPVMVGPAPVLRETVQKADIGVACRSASPQDLAKGIDCMVERTSNGYSQSLEAYRQHHSWEENARRTLEVYRTVIGVEK